MQTGYAAANDKSKEIDSIGHKLYVKQYRVGKHSCFLSTTFLRGNDFIIAIICFYKLWCTVQLRQEIYGGTSMQWHRHDIRHSASVFSQGGVHLQTTIARAHNALVRGRGESGGSLIRTPSHPYDKPGCIERRNRLILNQELCPVCVVPLLLPAGELRALRTFVECMSRIESPHESGQSSSKPHQRYRRENQCYQHPPLDQM